MEERLPEASGMDRARSAREELSNVVTHGIGVAASVAGAALLVTLAALRGDVWDVVGAAVFSATLLLLYVASTLYHAAREPRRKARLLVLDHCAIYLLIAGSYTPFMIGALRGPWGWSLLGTIWGLAALGVAFKLRFAGRFSLFSTGVYIAMGWLVVIAAAPMAEHIRPAALAWLVAGGLAYTFGAPLYQWARFRHAHALWHLFVLGGSTCHAIAVALQL